MKPRRAAWASRPLALAAHRPPRFASLGRSLQRFSREGRVLLTLVGVTAMFCVDVGRTEAHVLLAATTSLLVASLLFRGGYALAGVRAEAMASPRVGVGEDALITVTLHNEGVRRHQNLRIDPPRIGRDGAWHQLPPTVDRLDAGQRAQVPLVARFQKRGERRIGPILAAALVPWALVHGRGIATSPFIVRVVPRIAPLRHLEWPTRSSGTAGGSAYGYHKGEAMDLFGVRPYRPGDLPRDLHARSWARLGFPVVREYQQEQASRVAVVVDTDAAEATALAFEMALSLTAGLVAKLHAEGVLVDLVVLGSALPPLRLAGRRSAVNEALDALALVEPGAPFSLDQTLAQTAPLLEGLAAMFCVVLAPGGGRAELTAAMRDRRVACRVYWVGQEGSVPESMKQVLPHHIARGEGLAL